MIVRCIELAGQAGETGSIPMRAFFASGEGLNS